MDALEFRTRVAVLWVSVAVAMVGSLALMMVIPGALEDLLAGEIEGEALTDALGFVMAGMGTLPLVMAVVTLLISDRPNHWINLIVGLAFGGFVGVYGVIAHLALGPFNAHVLMGGIAGALAFVIAGLSLAALRRPRATAAPTASEYERPREEATV